MPHPYFHMYKEGDHVIQAVCALNEFQHFIFLNKLGWSCMF